MQAINFKYVVFCWLMMGCALYSVIRVQADKVINSHSVSEQNWAFAYWHNQLGRLTQLPLTVVEQRFAKDFPGTIGRFTDGKTVWVVRHVQEATRMLHSAVDCFRGLGYQISQPKVIAKNGRQWRCFEAERGQKLNVCERIFDAENQQWTDVSAWYWETLFQSGKHEWWAVTQVTVVDSVAVES